MDAHHVGAERSHAADPGEHDTVRAKATALAVLAAAAVVVLAPVRHHWTSRPCDSFPLSYYPMFSARRGATAKVVHPVGVRADGTRVDLPYSLVGAGGFNQSRRQIVRLVRDGRADDLAVQLARAVGSRNRWREVRAVEVVTGRYRFDTFFAGDRRPEKEVRHARADVPGRAGAAPTTVPPRPDTPGLQAVTP